MANLLPSVDHDMPASPAEKLPWATPRTRVFEAAAAQANDNVISDGDFGFS